ncbi:MAG: hypothetical protein COA43_11680 [Robiginitomaculum sp.]|nr:MAG: hypothetical protein COA43_11680 [Robiginitomaculum sp.]
MMGNKTEKFSLSLAFMVLVTIVLWATEYTLVGYVVKTISPAWIVAIRTLIAACILTFYVYFSGHKLPPFKDKAWLWYGSMGIIGMTIPFYLIARGEIHIDSGIAAILVGVTPLFIILLAHFLIPSERLTLLKTLGFLVGFTGTCLLFLPKSLSVSLVEHWQAQLLLLLAALGYATTTILGKRAPEIPASIGATIMLIGAAISASICALTTGLPHFLTNGTPPLNPILALLVLSVGATALGNLLYLRLIQISGPSLIAKINYMVPIFSILSGIVFLKEGLNSRTILALFIILAGLIIVRYGENKT